MQQNHQISRSNVNKSIVNAQDFPKSGFNLTYNSYGDYMLGRLHPTGFQYVMPSDKFSGRNEGNLTFNRLVTPQVSQVEGRQDNFFVTFRSIDKTFEEAFAPNKNNAMSAAWHVPTFTLKAVVSAWWNIFGSDMKAALIDATSALSMTNEILEYFDPDLGDFFNQLDSAYFNTGLNNQYMRDYAQDFRAYALSRLSGLSLTTDMRDFRYALFDALFTPFFGENSLLDVLGYNYLRKDDMWRLADVVASFPAYLGNLDDTPMSEYPLRAYYAIWYEYYRDVNLEPVSANLPKWKEFGSSPIVLSTGGLPFLLVRIRSWQTDMFTSSLPDDICRHVFAPIISSQPSETISFSSDASDYLNAESFGVPQSEYKNMTSQVLSYRDSVTGTTQILRCPVPASVNDALIALHQSNTIAPATLDLLSLRRAQMLEVYLKRNFYFGDEYRDRLLAHYGSRLSDMRINRPELLSSSISMIDLNQQVANVGTGTGDGQSQAGDRVVTATMSTNGDGYEFFAEEFGIVLNIVSFMPRAQYAGVCGQHLMYLQKDFPVPEFANQNEEFGRVMEVASNGLVKSSSPIDGGSLGMFGHYPYAHAWRSRVDEVHGSYLSDKQNYTFRRYFGFGEDGVFQYPKLNAEFLHCHPNLGMFANTVLLDGQLYGSFKHNFYVERVLPTPVENI